MPNWFEESDEKILERLKNVLRTHDFQFIGKYDQVPQKDFGFFKDVRSLSGVRKFYPLDNGTPDEFKVRPLEIYTKAYDRLKPGKWYKFYAVPANIALRKSKRNPFLLQTDWSRVRDIILLRGSDLIENIQNDARNTPEGIAGNLMRAIETISIDINTEPTTFIFELIQNADDYPNVDKNVDIAFQIDESYLIIKHNGSKFEVNNTVALCGVNERDKRDDTNKIGFKGIGFKSIFKDADYAYIKSGDFSFRFDEDFWKRQGIEIFWHITPIQTSTNEFNQILVSESNVNIIVKPRVPQTLKNYQNTFTTHFNNERILLFLRNVKSLHFESAGEKFEIQNSSLRWKILLENNVEVPDTETKELNRRINFPDKRIPVKFHDITSTEIGFGFKINNTLVDSINDGYIYAYLPTKVNLGFSFILNGNFIPDASRTKIYSDLSWNTFLFKRAGELFTKKIVQLIQNGFEIESVINQIPSFAEILHNINDDDKVIFINSFRVGFDTSVINEEFVPIQSGGLEKLSNILIDETGLADLLKEEFSGLTGISAKLTHKDVGKGIGKIKKLIVEYQQGVIYSVKNLKSDLKSVRFQEWLKIPENNFKIIQHFDLNIELKELLESEKIILSDNKTLNVASSIFRIIPNEITFIPTEKINKTLFSLLEKNQITLNLKLFEPVVFYKENILGKQSSINPSLKNELDLLNFWRFVFDSWTQFENDDIIKTSLKNYEVLCKSETENGFSKKIISFAYLSKEFNASSEIESVIKCIEIAEAAFISDKYIDQNRTADKWRRIFKLATAITDLQKVIEILVTKLPQIVEVSKHVEITQQLFKFWKDVANKLTDSQVALIKKDLKIKCIDKKFRNASECYLSDHYNNNPLISSILPNIELKCQVISDYGPKKNQVAEWKDFFKLIGCVELPEKQNVLDAKLAFFIREQEELRELHFDILKSISILYKAKRDNSLQFAFENILSQVKLQTSKGEWDLPHNTHLPSSYKPKLDLQNDETINTSIIFLSEKYLPADIDKHFLINLGVTDTFKFFNTKMAIDQIPPKYKKRIEAKYPNIAIDALRRPKLHQLINHITLNFPSLLLELRYSNKFWEQVLENNSTHIQFLFQESTYVMPGPPLLPFENFCVFFIKRNLTIPNQENVLKIPSDLYSASLKDYISEKNDLPKYDLSKLYYRNDQTKSLESILGIQSELSEEHCVELLCRVNNRISHAEVNELNIIDILGDYTPTVGEKDKLFLLNQNSEWKAVNCLFILKDGQFQIDSTQLLHEDFYSIAHNFGVQEISEENLVLVTMPATPRSTDEVVEFFERKTKYIAYKVDHINYSETESEIIARIKQFQFYEVISLSKVFPEVDPIYNIEIDFHYNDSEDKVFYKGNWKTNGVFIKFLFENIVATDKIQIAWFENVVNRWDDSKVIENIKEDFGCVPPEWETNNQNENSNTESDFFKEVRAFIDSMKVVEDIYDQDKIEELKSILESFKSHPEEKRKSFNLLAKLKLCKKLRIGYEKRWEFNIVQSGDEKYFIHSARGAFAYIHPHELLQMRDEGFKMAIDFGGNDIRMYNSHSDIIALYQNYLMLYQGNPPEEDIFNICENSQGRANFHFLIVDKEKQTNDALALLRILNNENYD